MRRPNNLKRLKRIEKILIYLWLFKKNATNIQKNQFSWTAFIKERVFCVGMNNKLTR